MNDNKNLEPLKDEQLTEVEQEKALMAKRSAELARIDGENVVISPTRLIWNNFKEKKIAILGLIMFGMILFVTIVIPLFTASDINDIDVTQLNNPPSWDHWFGTDKLGRDYFNRVVTGGRVSLMVGAIATFISVTLGVIVGSISGYYGGKVDNLLMRFAEIVRSFPFLPLAITLSAALGAGYNAQQRIALIMVILGLLGWTGLARLLRGQILTIREQEFMIAAKAVGIKDRNQIMRHILPNVVSIIIVSATLGFAVNILIESGLSFLGFGVTDPDVSWGLLIKDGTNTSIIVKDRPWLWFFPGILILFTVLSVNFIGDGLRDAIDPKSNTR